MLEFAPMRHLWFKTARLIQSWGIAWGIGLMSLVPGAAFSQEPPGTIGGAIEFEHPKSGPGVFSFQVGLENFQGDPALVQSGVESLVEIEQKSGDGIVQVFEVEGNPPVEIPAELEKKLDVQRITIPKAAVAEFEKVAGSAKSFWKDVYRAPTREDKVLAVTFMAVRAGIAGSVFFSDPTLGWQKALLMTLAVTGATGFNNWFNDTLTNVFTYNIKERKTWLGKQYSAAVVWLRNLSYDILMANAINEVGGRNTLRQSTVNGFFSNLAGSGFSSDRSRMLVNEEKQEQLRAEAQGITEEDAKLIAARRRSRLSFAYKLLLNPFTFAIQAYDNLGNIEPIKTFIGYEVRPTILLTFGIYAGLVGVNHIAREPLIRLLDRTYNRVEPQLNWIAKRFTPKRRTCNEVFDPARAQHRHKQPSLIGDEFLDGTL